MKDFLLFPQISQICADGIPVFVFYGVFKHPTISPFTTHPKRVRVGVWVWVWRVSIECEFLSPYTFNFFNHSTIQPSNHPTNGQVAQPANLVIHLR
jgi:hypothetical protein